MQPSGQINRQRLQAMQFTWRKCGLFMIRHEPVRFLRLVPGFAVIGTSMFFLLDLSLMYISL
jgi:hypothetical protein